MRTASMADLVDEMAAEIEAAAGDVSAADDSQIWVPRPAQPNRGIVLPDGRIVSPQELAVETPADELFFGGGPGGGKTDLVIGLALTQHKSSIVFRKERRQILGTEGMWARLTELVGLQGHPNSTLMTWTGLPGGRSIEFGGASNLMEALKYKGKPHDLKAFDELTEISEAVYRFLCGWLRTKLHGQRTRIVGTGNPPMTEEGQWVLRHWAAWLDPHHPSPAAPGELRWYAVDDDGKSHEVEGPAWGTGRPGPVLLPNMERMVRPRSRTFIPSAVEDNPDYVRTGYADVLDALPAELRSLRAGNFRSSVRDHPDQVIPTAWVEAAQRRWVARKAEDHGPLTLVGCDPQRGGADEFVIAKRRADWVDELVVHDGRAVKSTPAGENLGLAGASLIAAAISDDPQAVVQIDADGIGTSVYDHALGLKIRAVSMNGAAASRRRDRTGRFGFANKRSEWHWRMREELDPAHGATLALPPDPRLRADLCAPRFELTTRGVKVEPKEDIKARIGRSPDRGEGVIYSVADEHTLKELVITSGADAVQIDRADPAYQRAYNKALDSYLREEGVS